MATIKTVYGYIDGNKNKRANQISKNVWLLCDSDDPNYCYEKDGLLYRFQWNHSPELEDRIKEADNNGQLLPMMEKAIYFLLDCMDGERLLFPNVGFFALCGRLEDYEKVKEYNKKIKAKEEKERQEKEAARQAKAKEAEKRRITKALEDYRKGEKIDPEMFLIICKNYNISLHLRTIGWLKNKCHLIGSNGYTYYAKGTKGSQKIYDAIRDLNKALNIA